MNYSLKYAWVGLGSNQGDCLDILQQALQEISSLPIVNLRASPIYLSEPWGYTQQAKFLNQVITFHTTIDAMELLNALFKIEKKFHRQRNIHWGPRTLDLDLLDYQDQINQQESLILPHPRLHLRRFVLQPWYDLEPDHYISFYQTTIQELLKCCPDKSPLIPLSSL